MVLWRFFPRACGVSRCDGRDERVGIPRRCARCFTIPFPFQWQTFDVLYRGLQIHNPSSHRSLHESAVPSPNATPTSHLPPFPHPNHTHTHTHTPPPTHTLNPPPNTPPHPHPRSPQQHNPPSPNSPSPTSPQAPSSPPPPPPSHSPSPPPPSAPPPHSRPP